MTTDRRPTLDLSKIKTHPLAIFWRSDLRVTATSDADGSCRHVEDPRNGKFYRVGAAEFTLLSQFDGRTTADVLRAANQLLGDRGFSEADANAVIQWGLQTGLLTLAPCQTQLSGNSPSLKPVPGSATARKPWSLLSI